MSSPLAFAARALRDGTAAVGCCASRENTRGRAPQQRRDHRSHRIRAEHPRPDHDGANTQRVTTADGPAGGVLIGLVDLADVDHDRLSVAMNGKAIEVAGGASRSVGASSADTWSRASSTGSAALWAAT